MQPTVTLTILAFQIKGEPFILFNSLFGVLKQPWIVRRTSIVCIPMIDEYAFNICIDAFRIVVTQKNKNGLRVWRDANCEPNMFHIFQF